MNFKSPPSIRDGSGIHLSQVFVSIVTALRDASRPRLELPCLLLIPSGGTGIARYRFVFTHSHYLLTLILHWIPNLLPPVVFITNSLQMKSCILACIWTQQKRKGVLLERTDNLLAGSFSRHDFFAAQISPSSVMRHSKHLLC